MALYGADPGNEYFDLFTEGQREFLGREVERLRGVK